MDEEIKKRIEELDNRRAQILQTLCEDERIIIPEVLLGLIHEARSITRVLRLLKSSGDEFR